ALLFVTVLFFLSCAQKTERQQLIQGRVTAGGNGIGNVVVTDGFNCVVTDSDGSYSMVPDNNANFVYISTPAGYLPEEKMNLPQFYQKIEREKEKRYDFQLTENPKDDENHLLLVHADPQFHKEENFQMYEKVVEDIQQLKTGYPDRDILGIDCGDLVGDKPELYPLYIEHLNRTEIPFYRLPGNHDLQFGGRTTESSTQRYEETFGPDHYSFSRGQIHYIVLNNVFYLGRDYFYMGYIDEKTFEWLEQYLSYVPEGSTLIVSMHIPGRLDEEVKPFQYDSQTISAQTINISSLFEMLRPYKVHLLTGHMHYNRNIIHAENLYEHNTGAVSGAWWQGDYCLDGTPMG
ncbi:MAG: metallophosphoesterase, partial [Proteiniphilum sp.]|nr:metallophosphoesterase [Proteiniphilum sp.]